MQKRVNLFQQIFDKVDGGCISMATDGKTDQNGKTIIYQFRLVDWKSKFNKTIIFVWLCRCVGVCIIFALSFANAISRSWAMMLGEQASV